MKFQAVKGTRDFYPADMAALNVIFDAWRRVSRRNGFVEYDGPILEHLDLLTAKSGEEIVSQLFSLTDRAGRRLALRPEMTPTLARMINARAQSLSRPIKWFSVPRCFRAERPQRGRLREFFQWNIDVVGESGALADAETIFVAVDLLRELGLGPQDVVVKISSRSLIAALLDHVGIAGDDRGAAYTLLDRAAKLPAEVAAKQWDDRFGAALEFARLQAWLASPDPASLAEQVSAAATPGDAVRAATDHLDEVLTLLRNLGILEYCDFDLRIVRGLAYYTGTVFEILDRAETMRAVCGGGRYDNLLAALGGPDMPAIGFGMGDVVLANLLAEKGRAAPSANALDVFLIDAEPDMFPLLLELAGRLRGQGIGCVFSYRRAGVGKQLREAAARDAAYVVIVGLETRERGVVTVKDLATGQQHEASTTALLEDPRGSLLRTHP